MSAPVCSDCHTAHAILQPTESAFRMQSTPICGNCHKDKFSTYRDTFHSQFGSLGGYVETARCWDCHGAHDVLPASDPNSPINKANLVSPAAAATPAPTRASSSISRTPTRATASSIPGFILCGCS
jgi:predicted CXXCH cytochrome family protein